MIGCWLIRWNIFHERATFLLPLEAPTVHDPDVLMAVVLEKPQGIACKPVGLIAIKNNRGIVGDSQFGSDLFEFFLRQEIAAQWMLQRAKPIHLDSARDMTDRVE